MTVTFCTDEHVPSVFVTTLRSSGYDVVRAIEELGEGTNDERLLQFCAEEDHILITHDKKDFSRVGETVDHNGIMIYTDPVALRDTPAEVVRTIDFVFEHVPPDELAGERIWLRQWRDAFSA